MRFAQRHLIFFVLALLALACADATPAPEAEGPDPGVMPTPVACDPNTGITLGEDSVPCIGPGEVENPPEGNYIEPTLDNADLEDAKERFLTQDGQGKLFIYVGETQRAGVRTVDVIGRPVEGQRIAFEIVESDPGQPSEATISGRMSDTNEFGVADVRITAGPQPSFFYLKMTSEGLDSLQYQVNVLQRPIGLEVEPPDPNDPNRPPPVMGTCMETKGHYSINNLYEPARLLGDGPFEALDDIHRILSDPGGFLGDLIRDRIGGVWGSVVRGAVRPVINYLYNYVINNYAPDWLRDTLLIVEDVTALLVELEIAGQMELGQVDADCALNGLHRWETLVFHWRYGCAAGDDMCGRFEIPLERLGAAASESAFTARVVQNFGPVATLEIDEHSLQLNLGVAVIWFLQEFILPQRFNVNSFGELLSIVLPCDAVGDLAADYLSGIPLIGGAVGPLVERACRAGMESAGNHLTHLLTERLSVNTFPMQGQCKIRDTDADQLADTLKEGRWTADLEGDFSGERIR